MQGIQARLNLTASQREAVDALCVSFQQSARRAYSWVKRGKLASEDLRLHFVSEALWVEAQIKSLVLQVQQWLASDQESTNYRLEQARLRHAALLGGVAGIKEQLLSMDKNPLAFAPNSKGAKRQEVKRVKLKQSLFGKTRKLADLAGDIKALEAQAKAGGKARVFGSRKLLRQRQQMEDPSSPFDSAAHWRAHWDRKRAGGLVLVGAGAAQCGNHVAQIQLSEKAAGESQLILRLSEPQAQERLQAMAVVQNIPIEKLKGKLSCKRLAIPFSLTQKFHRELEQAQNEGVPITVSLTRKLTPKGKRQEAKAQFTRGYSRRRTSRQSKSAPKRTQNGSASSCQIDSYEESYYLHASFETKAPGIKASRHQGGVGVDLNARGFSYAFVKPDGNIAKDSQGKNLHGEVRLPVHRGKNGKETPLSTAQVKHWLGQELKTLVRLARDYRAAIAIEDLDFAAKKAALSDQPAGYSRMLSTLRTAGFEGAIRSRCRKEGVALHKVSPAYTSVCGAFKYAQKHGLDFDKAAALVLGRAVVLGADPNAHLDPVPTRNKATGKKLSPKFVRTLHDRRNNKVIRHVERVCASRPLPEPLLRMVFGQGEGLVPAGGTRVSWKHVRKALGSRNEWRTSLGLSPQGKWPSRKLGTPPGLSRRLSRLGPAADCKSHSGPSRYPAKAGIALGSPNQQIR